MGELVQKVFRRDFRRIDVRSTRVILIESNERLLKAYPAELSASAKRQLEQLGVEVPLGRAGQQRDGDVASNLMTAA